jgi:signal transduction histidine kinase
MNIHLTGKKSALAGILLLLFTGGCRTQDQPILPSSTMILEGCWEYRWGDSPVDDKGTLTWLKEVDHLEQWKSVTEPSNIPLQNGQQHVWVRIRLSNLDNNENAVFIDRIEKVFEVYLDSTKIYSFGSYTPGTNITLPGFAWHLIKLPRNADGKTLFFRIHSDSKYIGFYSPVRFGSEEYFLTKIVNTNLSKIILGIIFLFAGFALFLFLFVMKNVRPFLGLIIFMIAGGIWTLSNSKITQILFSFPKVIYYADHLSLIASAVGFFLMAVEIIDMDSRKWFKRVYQVLTVYGVVVAILDITGISDSMDTVAPFLVIVILSVFAFTYVLFLSARKGNREAKILLIALAVYAVFALLDIINYFQHVVVNPETYEMRFAHYGGFGFLIVMAWILISRYIKMNRQMLLAQVNERTRIARDLHDEVGPRLTEIKIVSERGKSRSQLSAEEQANAEELSSTVDTVVSTLSEIVWALTPTNETLEELGTYLGQYAIDFLRKPDIRCRLALPPELPSLHVSYDVRRNIVLAVKESLNNIVKHADASLVTLTLNIEEQMLEVIIQDDGHGFDLATARQYGNGLKNIHRRIESIGGTVTIDSTLNIGTTTNILLPLSKLQASMT